MPDSTTSNNDLEVGLRLELVEALRPLAEGDGSLPQAMERALADVLRTLGIPGQPAAEIKLLAEEDLPGARFLRLRVNGQLCRYSTELLQGVHSYVTGQWLNPEATPTRLLDWLSELLANGGHERAVEFLALTCIEIVKQQPAVLLTLPQAQAYAASLRELEAAGEATPTEGMLESVELLSILKQVLSLNISIADQRAVSQIMRSGAVAGRTAEDIAEDLIATLCPETLDILLPSEHLRQLTTAWQDKGPEMFPFLRDGLFVELGLTYPSFRFAPRDDLRPNSFAFNINHLTTLPLIGLRPDRCLVNDTVDRLKLHNIQGVAAANPATSQPGSMIDLSLQGQAEALGLTTWNQMGYVILCMAHVLRRNSACFVHRRFTQAYLEQLRGAFPHLVKAVRARMTDEHVTRLLRELVGEEISIRNLRMILELALDYDLTTNESSSLSFVRAGLQRQLSHKYARSTNTLVVYLLDHRIEQHLLDRQISIQNENGKESLDEEDDKILAAIRAEIAYLPPTAMVPALLTTVEAREGLRNLITFEFPRLAVISYGEVPPNTNIQPVARIQLQS